MSTYARKKELLEKLKETDPEQAAAIKRRRQEKSNENKARWVAKNKAKYNKQQAEWNRLKNEKMKKADPEGYKNLLARRAEYKRKHAAHAAGLRHHKLEEMKKNNPKKYQRLLTKRRKERANKEEAIQKAIDKAAKAKAWRLEAEKDPAYRAAALKQRRECAAAWRARIKKEDPELHKLRAAVQNAKQKLKRKADPKLEAKHRAKERVRGAAWREQLKQHPELLERQREAVRRSHAKHKDKRAAEALLRYYDQYAQGRARYKETHARQKGTIDYQIKARLTSAKDRAKKLGLPFDLTFDYLKNLFLSQEQKCPLTGRPFSIGQKRSINSLSLDRITPSKGYVQGNVRFIIWGMNTAMMEWGEAAFSTMCLDYLNQRTARATTISEETQDWSGH